MNRITGLIIVLIIGLQGITNADESQILSAYCKRLIGNPKLSVEYDSTSIRVYSTKFCWYNCLIAKTDNSKPKSLIIVNQNDSFVVTNKISRKLNDQLIKKYGSIKEYIGVYTSNKNYEVKVIDENILKVNRLSGCSTREIIIKYDCDSVEFENLNEDECPRWLCGMAGTFYLENEDSTKIK